MNPETKELFKIYAILTAIGLLFVFGLVMCYLWSLQSSKDKKISAKLFRRCALVEIAGVIATILLLQNIS
ncbi:MAG: hypothetical protein HFJ51_07395 [Clostridia bacterium]|nr:hypothetical protein [Clostridia bacterium]